MSEYRRVLSLKLPDRELRQRLTTVGVFDSETPYLYEKGNPILETDLPWSLNVGQEIPRISEGSAVSVEYLRELAVLVINEMHEEIPESEASCLGVQEVLADPRCSPDAVHSIVTKQHGPVRVAFDPLDVEANSKAAAFGGVVLRKGAYTKQQWINIRACKAIVPAGEVFPTPLVYSEEGIPARVVPPDQLTKETIRVSEYAVMLADRLLGREILVIFENEITQEYYANYAPGVLTFNYPRLGAGWFNLDTNFVNVTDLILHELAHEWSPNHLSQEYYDALSRLGAEAAWLALTDPDQILRLIR